MYCFSQICRICLSVYTTDSMHLHAFDYDKIKIHEKLKFCVPEIVSDDAQLPENVCDKCQVFLQQMYIFKQMCIDNTNILHQYVSQLSSGINLDDHIKSNLYVAMDPVKIEHESENEVVEKQNSDGVSMYSISLNQWDLFETKFTCRCIKEYGSFTENTEHLCKNCEGDLHGFRLSKIKVGIAENRYNNSLSPSQLESDDNYSNFSRCDVSETNEKKYEHGFDYNDLLLCKVHINGVKKQMNILNNDTSVSTEENVTNDEPEPLLIKELKNKYSCTLCDKSYSRRYNLHNHFAKHEESKFYYCTKCSHKFITKDELKEHYSVHQRHTINEIKYDSSLKQIKINQSFEQHNLTGIKIESDSEDDNHNFSQQDIKPDLNNSDDNLICGTCDKVFDHKSHLAIHLLTHFGRKEFKCLECGKEFFRKENFIEHKKVHKPNRKFECNQCEKSYNHRSNLRRHQQSHAGKYLCSICNAKFTKKDVLEEHIFATHTKPKAHKVFSCLSCKRTFTHIDHLKAHELFNHAKSTIKISAVRTKRHSCGICKKTFSHVDNLKMHALSHSDRDMSLAPYKISTEEGKGHYCPICNRIYSIKTNIRKHLKTHSNARILSCIVCKQEFTNTYLLRQHIKTHPEELNFKCHLCDKAYLTKTNLTRHIDTHHTS